MCGQVDKVWFEPDHKITNSLNINQVAVVGSLAAGFGHAQMEQMLAAMSISCMSSKTYMKLCESNISDRWLQCTNSVMKAAGEEERRIAVETGCSPTLSGLSETDIEERHKKCRVARVGCHEQCATYFCDGTTKADEQNLIPALRNIGLFNPIQDAMIGFTKHVKSLLAQKTSNIAESFFALVCKANNGKRTLMTQRGAYGAHIAVAVVAHNTGAVLSTYKTAMGVTVPVTLKKMESERLKKNKENIKAFENPSRNFTPGFVLTILNSHVISYSPTFVVILNM
ncbi:hypothetical protein PV325_006648 [Microctonus aethiopoides]|nr:hypothetical protein PV325_006648 [Microctonus aethiopoides]